MHEVVEAIRNAERGRLAMHSLACYCIPTLSRLVCLVLCKGFPDLYPCIGFGRRIRGGILNHTGAHLPSSRPQRLCNLRLQDNTGRRTLCNLPWLNLAQTSQVEHTVRTFQTGKVRHRMQCPCIHTEPSQSRRLRWSKSNASEALGQSIP